MKVKKRIVIIGATSAIAEHCTRLWVQDRSTDLILVGRDAQRTERIATDIRVRSPESDIRTVQTGFLNPDTIAETVASIVQTGDVDIALIAQGFVPEQANCQENLQTCHETLEVNGVSPVLYAEAFAKHMTKANRGTIALIGSVAGDRGRKSNYVYGAAKGLIARYAQGLQHRFSGTGVKVVLIKPGPTDTPMTARLKDKGARLAPVESVARQIVKGVEAGRPVIYTPGKWRLIMLIFQHMPAFVFQKMDI